MLQALALIVFGCAGLVASVYVASTCDNASVFTLAAMLGMAAWVASEFAQGIAQDAALAAKATGLSLKEIAAISDRDMAPLSRQLSAQERLDYALWCGVPNWEPAFHALRAKRLGGYSVIPDGIVADAVHALTRFFNREAAA